MNKSETPLRRVSRGGAQHEPGWFARRWIAFWMRMSGPGPIGRLGSRFAAWLAPPHMEQISLAYASSRGYIDATATIYHSDLLLGQNVYLGPGVVVAQTRDGGPVSLGDRAEIHREVLLETGRGGYIEVGRGSGIHPRCQLKAYVEPIVIGTGVMIASDVAIYSYDHGMEPDVPISRQPLVSRGSIQIENGAWVGTGAVILSGVNVGEGAVVGAGAVVTKDVPAGAIAVGNPARIIKYRHQLRTPDSDYEQR